MLLWSTRVNLAVFAVFGVLEITEIILFAGFFLADAGKSAGADVIKLGGYVGVLTALVAWYTSAAVVVNSMAGRAVLPVGRPMWAATAGTAPTAPSAARA